MRTGIRINFDRNYGILIFLEVKTSTIRLEKKASKNDYVILTLDEKDFAEARVTDVIDINVSGITKKVALEDGFLTVYALKKTLKKYYPDITDETVVYQIKFSIEKILNLSLIEKDIINLCNIAIRQGFLSEDEKDILKRVLNEGIESLSDDILKELKGILRKVYLKLVSE